MKYVSVCSGIEAATNAWHKFGWTPVAFSEIEPFPSAVLKHRFPNTPNHGDLTQYKSWPIEPGSIDLLVGGTPCQSFSVAGLRKGLADPRGNLCLTFLGLADHLRPRYILWENVVGVLSSGGGRDFGAFLGALGQLGYGWSYRVLNAEHFGVPQRRRRVFVLAHRDPVTGVGDWRIAAEALSIGEGLQRYIAQGKQTRKKPSANVAESSREGSPVGAGGVGAGCWWDGGQVSQTLDAVLAKGQTMPEKNRFPAVLQPMPVVIDRAAFNQGENALYEPHIGESEVMDTVVARGPHAIGIPPMMFKIRGGSPVETGEQGGTPGKGAGKGFLGSEEKTFTIATSPDQWLAQPIVAPTVTTCKGSRGGSSSEAIDEITAIHLAQQDPFIVQASELRLNDKITEQKVCPTLKANTKSGDTEPLAVHCSKVSPTVSSGAPFSKTGNERVEADALVVQPQGVDLYNQTLTGDVHVPLRTAGGHGAPAVAFQPGNLRRKGGADPSTETFPTLTKDSGDQSPHVAVEMVVRRLSVNECMRLQGFPDNWTNIPWKGKPAGQAPDGPQYKCAGNSMAVPCMSWIAEGIIRVEAKLKEKV